MILRSDLAFPGQQIFYGVIQPAMAVVHFEGGDAVGFCQNLVPETDSEDRITADKFFEIRNDCGEWFRVARSIREPNPVRLKRNHVFCRGVSRNDRDSTIKRRKVSQAVVLQTEVISHHVKASLSVSARFRLCRSRMQQHWRAVR